MLAAKAWSKFKSKSQYYNEECKHDNGCVGDTDSLPTLEPNLTAPAQSVHSAPEAM